MIRHGLQLGVFDLDGTLVPWKSAEYIWSVILTDANLVSYNAELRNEYDNGLIDYSAWHESLFKRMAEAGMTRRGLVGKISHSWDQAAISPHAVSELIRQFQFTAVLSGSLDLALEVAGYKYDIFDALYCHRIGFGDDDRMNRWTVNPYGTGEGKVDGIKSLMLRFGIGPYNTFYVGDSANDLPVINWLNLAGGLAIALPPIARQVKSLARPDRTCEKVTDVGAQICLDRPIQNHG